MFIGQTKSKAVDLLCLDISSLTLMLPCCSNVANLFCHMPSMIMMSSSSPCLTQSMIWRLKCWYPHLAKCLPSGVLWSSISLLCPECLLCIASVVLLGRTYLTCHQVHNIGGFTCEAVSDVVCEPCVCTCKRFRHLQLRTEHAGFQKFNMA